MSAGMAIPGWIPVEACSERAQVAAIPPDTTAPPMARPKVRSLVSSGFADPSESSDPSDASDLSDPSELSDPSALSVFPGASVPPGPGASPTRRAYTPKRTATKRAAAPSRSSLETSEAPVLVSRTARSPLRSNMSEKFPDPV